MQNEKLQPAADLASLRAELVLVRDRLQTIREKADKKAELRAKHLRGLVSRVDQYDRLLSDFAVGVGVMPAELVELSRTMATDSSIDSGFPRTLTGDEGRQ